MSLADVGDWATLSLTLTARTDEKSPQGLDSELTGYALLSCTSTRIRIPFPLAARGETPNELHGTIDISRDDVAGTATLIAEIAAEYRGAPRIVGRSIPWTIVIEPGSAPVKPGQPPISQSWIDFGALDSPLIARQSPEAPSVLDLSAAKPMLLLNSAIPGFQDLLSSETAKLERRRTRELLGSQIARYTLATLFRAAAVEIASEDDEPVPPSDPLFRQVCEAVADTIPHFASTDELYHRLHDSHGKRAESAELWTHIDVAIDVLAGIPNTLAMVTEEIRRG
ncbi:hypothetical protein [Rhodococcus wratislaviensis]|uniref:hypothetical protein n=1 Tax=Rhodococcus wratislaviensis TaxID=44752 RepID=UPI003519BE9F